MARQLELFGPKPRKPPRILAHADDCGDGTGKNYSGHFVCSVCGWAEWCEAKLKDIRRGVPCPDCNNQGEAERGSKCSAVIDGTWRYELRRIWHAGQPLLVVCMLNPSTADAERNDPTIVTLMRVARAWGFGGLLVVNLFALRTSDPATLMRAADRVGPQNYHYLQNAIEYAREQGGRLLVGWGNCGDIAGRDEWFADWAVSWGVDLICLGTTASGAPKHPLARGKHRIPADQKPVLWRAANA